MVFVLYNGTIHFEAEPDLKLIVTGFYSSLFR